MSLVHRASCSAPIVGTHGGREGAEEGGTREGEGGLKAGRAVMPESLRAEISTSLFSTRELARSDRRSFDRARARTFLERNRALV